MFKKSILLKGALFHKSEPIFSFIVDFITFGHFETKGGKSAVSGALKNNIYQQKSLIIASNLSIEFKYLF